MTKVDKFFDWITPDALHAQCDPDTGWIADKLYKLYDGRCWCCITLRLMFLSGIFGVIVGLVMGEVL